MRRNVIGIALVLAAASLVGLLGAPVLDTAAQDTPPAATPHPFAGETDWIAYYGASGEGMGLIHPDGTGDHRIAGDVRDDQLLANWSPDGTRLVFTTRGGGETEPLFEYDLATSASRQLFACEAPCIGDDEPVYSPDGTRVAFIRALVPFVDDAAHQGGDVSSDCGPWIGDLTSGEVTQITSNTNPPCDREYFPRWSPDGRQFTYWRDPYENGKAMGTSVYVINADGTDEQQLTDPAMFAGDSDWSPDGEWIVFTAATPTSRSLWAMPARGGEPIVLAPGGVYTHGTWQPTPAST
jgi:Tol biopolymer transport system component